MWINLSIWLIQCAENRWDLYDETFDRRWSNNSSKQDAINSWKTSNDYPRGTIRYRTGASSGIEIFQTNNASSVEMTGNAAQTIGGYLGYAGLALMFAPVPGARVIGGALVLASMFSSVSGAIINIGERHERGQNDLASNAWDYFEIATCALGAAGVALRRTKPVLNAARPVLRRSRLLRRISIPARLQDDLYQTGTYVLYGEMSLSAIGAVAILGSELDSSVNVLRRSDLTLAEKIGMFLEVIGRIATTSALLVMDVRASARQVSNATRPNPISGLQNGETIMRAMNDSSEPPLEVRTPTAEGNSRAPTHTTVISTEQRAIARRAMSTSPQPNAARSQPRSNELHFGDIKAVGESNLIEGWRQMEEWYHQYGRFQFVEDQMDIIGAVFQYDRRNGAITGTYRNWVTPTEIRVVQFPRRLWLSGEVLRQASEASGNVPTDYGNYIERHVADRVEEFTGQRLYDWDKSPQHHGPDLLDQDLAARIREIEEREAIEYLNDE